MTDRSDVELCVYLFPVGQHRYEVTDVYSEPFLRCSDLLKNCFGKKSDNVLSTLIVTL